MRLLITGGAGFIGSNFVRYMLRTYPEYKIIVLDKLIHAGRIENLWDILDKIELDPKISMLVDDGLIEEHRGHLLNNTIERIESMLK